MTGEENIVKRLIFGGAEIQEVNEIMKHILSLKGIEVEDNYLNKFINDIFDKNAPEKKQATSKLEDFVTFVTSGGEKLQSVTFSLLDCYNSLDCKSASEKAACRMALKRMTEKGIIEATGHKSGHYKVISQEDKAINLGDLSDLKGEMKIVFPMEVHKWIKVMPKTVYIIAGETDSGKSAYLLNFAKLNCHLYRTHYHSSEMGKAEFLDRLQYFWIDAHLNENMKFYERSDDFATAIRRNPNDIHIIDYIQLFDNFYLMAEIIDKIGKAVKNGMVFIAIQKPKGRDEGIGGERTKDLSRLYLAMSPGQLKIVKAKNWRNSQMNPNGAYVDFKLVNGCNFIPQGDWKK